MLSITDQVKSKVVTAIKKHALGDAVQFDAALVMLPQSPPVHFVTFLIPASVLGEFHQAGGFLERAHQVSDADIDDFVRLALENLRAERSKLLSEGAGGSSGLILG